MSKPKIEHDTNLELAKISEEPTEEELYYIEYLKKNKDEIMKHVIFNSNDDDSWMDYQQDGLIEEYSKLDSKDKVSYLNTTINEEKLYINSCIICGIDMGLQNPRQLCGKTYCMYE